MEIQKLTRENSEILAYPCMNKRNLFIWNPKKYRDRALPILQNRISKDIQGVVAVENNRSIGHIFYGSVQNSGFPIRCQDKNAIVILCSFIEKKYAGKRIGRTMLEAVCKNVGSAPGILVMATSTKYYMHDKSFIKLGFHSLYHHNLWHILYFPIKKKTINTETYDPELEWDYVRPFTFITYGLCPFSIQLWEKQKKVAFTFKDLLPIEELSYQEALKKDENVVPGFYLFGKLVPPGPLTGWKLKRYIKKAVRTESYKTFGTTSPSAYSKRKK